MMQWLIDQCGLLSTDLQKLKDQQINESNIEFCSAEDFTKIGLPIGPSRQLNALIMKLKHNKRNGQLCVPSETDSGTKQAFK